MTISTISKPHRYTTSTGTESSAGPSHSHDGLVTLASHSTRRRFLWGQPWQLGSASYWVARCEEHSGPPTRHALGSNLAEEIAACILGGYGIPASVGLAAFASLRDRGLFDGRSAPTGAELEHALLSPIDVGGRQVRYRFASQRGHRLARALSTVAEERPPDDPLQLRAWLQELPGIGPKTASWIVRNHLGSDAVAIIDIHIQRAGVLAGVFDPAWEPRRDYGVMEAFFLDWAAAGEVRASDLDAVIWSDMSSLGRSAARALGAPNDSASWYAEQARP